MNLYYLCLIVLFAPAYSANKLAQYTGNLDVCPYTKDMFMSIITLGRTEEYIELNDFATAACFYEIEEDYEKALDAFLSNITKVSCKVGAIYSKYDSLLQNFPFFATKALTELGFQLKQYYVLIKKAYRTAKFDIVKQYEKDVRKIADTKFDLYLRNLNHFERKQHCTEKVIKSTIHQYCVYGMKKFLSVGRYFKHCMIKRLNETEVYLESLKGQKNITNVTLDNS